MSEVISSERLDEVARWELPDIGSSGGAGESGLKASARSTQALEELQKQAWKEGYEDGRKKGYLAGEADVERRAGQLQALIEAIREPLREADQAFLQEMGGVAMALARAVVGVELRLCPEHVVDLARQAISELPAETRKVRVQLNPDDLGLVRESLPELEREGHLKLEEAAQLARGECMVISEGAHVDGTIDARLSVLAGQMLDAEPSTTGDRSGEERT